MQQYLFSNSSIDLACEEVGKFLASADVELREALRIKLTLEEVLLKYQSKFGEEAAFRVRCVKRLLLCGKQREAHQKEDYHEK